MVSDPITATVKWGPWIISLVANGSLVELPIVTVSCHHYPLFTYLVS